MRRVEKTSRKARRQAKSGSRVTLIIVIVCLAVFIFSGVKLLTILREYKVGEKEYADLAQYTPQQQALVLPEAAPQTEPAETDPAQETQPGEAPVETQVPEETQAPLSQGWVYPENELELMDFEPLKAINPDVVGWIRIFDTVIDYPIVQTDNDSEYLSKTFEGVRNGTGCLFVSRSNTLPFRDANTVVYGHNMKNGSMFHCLNDYKKEDFLQEHRYGVLYTPGKTYWLDILGGYVTPATSGFDTVRFPFEEDRVRYMENALDQLDTDTGLTAENIGPLLTLSTCTYEYNNARYAVHARIMP